MLAELTPADGMKRNCVIKSDQLVLIQKAKLTNFVARLNPGRLKALNEALAIALDLE